MGYSEQRDDLPGEGHRSPHNFWDLFLMLPEKEIDKICKLSMHILIKLPHIMFEL